MPERPSYTGTYVMNDADSLVCVLKVAFHFYSWICPVEWNQWDQMQAYFKVEASQMMCLRLSRWFNQSKQSSDKLVDGGKTYYCCIYIRISVSLKSKVSQLCSAIVWRSTTQGEI